MNASTFNALLLADARLPTGSYAYSGGLEPAVIAGLQANEVYPYMLARLATLTQLECSSCVQAHRLALERAPVAAYVRLESAVDARTPSAALRGSSRALGRALLYLGRSLRAEDPGVVALQALAAPPMRGTALGVLGAALGVDEGQCAEICCYEDLQGIAAASLKLLPVTPTVVTSWVIEAGRQVDEVIRRARAVQRCSELPAFSAPWMDFHAEEHVHRTRRLFVA